MKVKNLCRTVASGFEVFSVVKLLTAGHSGRAVQGVGLGWLVGCWDHGFDSCSRNGCLSLVFLCCVVLCR
jgi:hypothetical protein